MESKQIASSRIRLSPMILTAVTFDQPGCRLCIHLLKTTQFTEQRNSETLARIGKLWWQMFLAAVSRPVDVSNGIYGGANIRTCRYGIIREIHHRWCSGTPAITLTWRRMQFSLQYSNCYCIYVYGKGLQIAENGRSGKCRDMRKWKISMISLIRQLSKGTVARRPFSWITFVTGDKDMDAKLQRSKRGRTCNKDCQISTSGHYACKYLMLCQKSVNTIAFMKKLRRRMHNVSVSLPESIAEKGLVWFDEEYKKSEDLQECDAVLQEVQRCMTWSFLRASNRKI